MHVEVNLSIKYCDIFPTISYIVAPLEKYIEGLQRSGVFTVKKKTLLEDLTHDPLHMQSISRIYLATLSTYAYSQSTEYTWLYQEPA